MRALLEPLIGKSGSISMLVSRIGPIAFPVAENKKLTGVEIRPDGLIQLKRQTGWAVIDPNDVVAVVERRFGYLAGSIPVGRRRSGRRPRRDREILA